MSLFKCAIEISNEQQQQQYNNFLVLHTVQGYTQMDTFEGLELGKGEEEEDEEDENEVEE